MKILLITGTDKRHNFFIDTFIENFKDQIYVIQEKKYSYLESNKKVIDSKILTKYFEDRNSYESIFFELKSKKYKNLYFVERNTVNSKENIDLIQKINPDYILLYGSSIIKEPILKKYKNKVLNMHLGISPYYKGSGTNFWPIVDNNFSCLGVTYHLATLNVDGGPILKQIRPENLLKNDNIHQIGNKIIKAGIELYPKIFLKYISNEIKSKKQDKSIGKEFRRNDLNETSLKKAMLNIKNRCLEIYLLNKKINDDKYTIIN